MAKITASAIIEVLGSPKEHVNETLNMLVKKLKEDTNFKLLKHEMFDAVAVENTPFWTGFVDIELEFKKFEQLTGFCFDYYPSSVEVIEPENLNIKNNELSILFNDLAARLHKTHQIVKEVHASNIVLADEIKKYRAKEAEAKK